MSDPRLAKKVPAMHAKSLELIGKLKKQALSQCQERILQAAERPKPRIHYPEGFIPHSGFTAALKQRHGL
jgi:hypothetical protein